MLKIYRSEPPSQFLKLVERPKEELFDWARRTESERQQRRAPIRADLFHREDVHSQIANEFDHKCAFCECHLGNEGGVDHFRPKSLYPWLSYEWENLFYVCRNCNNKKSNLFPLKGKHAPFLATLEDARAIEKPLLIDPTFEYPGQHLTFLSSGLITPRSNSQKGLATINTLQLNRESWVLDRQKFCEKSLDIWKRSLEGNPTYPEGFLVSGEFLACQHWAIARSIAEFKKLPTSKVTGRDLINELKMLIANSDEALRSRLTGAILDVQMTDKGKSSVFLNTSRNALVKYRASVPDTQESDSFEATTEATEYFARDNVSSIQIANFKAIEKLAINMPLKRGERAGAPCMLLLGENAVGKSSFLLGVGLALLGSKAIEKLDLPYGSLARSVSKDIWDQWGTEAIEVKLEFHNERQPAVFSFDPVSKKLGGTSPQTAIVLGYGPHRFFSAAKSARKKSSAERLRSLFDPSKPLPDPTDWLSKLEGAKFNAVARTIRTILPIGDDDDLVNDPQSGICVRADGQMTPVSRLSEGYRSVFAMTADICRALLEHWTDLEDARAVVLIDEIDTHLHPRWKLQVMSSLRRALPKVQFIVTSHDPLCVRGMDDGEVVVLYRDEAGRVSQMIDLPDVSGMGAEQLLNSEYFGLASTLDADIHMGIARISSDGGDVRGGSLGEETDQLISRLTVGDSATAQIIQEALLQYLRGREKPVGSLSQTARAKAVAAVANALRSAKSER
ncbi:retron system putative HNH endonuclease [Loktanella sp. M215]|uniref:retron system putative HNH endonuclease n=1 Tax=Loktanella sp. M215 TaxID=2675431 RepID=UPI001EFFCC16|nr:retron system putative HNH endonuclease [Loktanella sp. M215]MCF7697982.1 TIGR02646 family protein [Loktanella sp. M215]